MAPQHREMNLVVKCSKNPTNTSKKIEDYFLHVYGYELVIMITVRKPSIKPFIIIDCRVLVDEQTWEDDFLKESCNLAEAVTAAIAYQQCGWLEKLFSWFLYTINLRATIFIAAFTMDVLLYLNFQVIGLTLFCWLASLQSAQAPPVRSFNL